MSVVIYITIFSHRSHRKTHRTIGWKVAPKRFVLLFTWILRGIPYTPYTPLHPSLLSNNVCVYIYIHTYIPFLVPYSPLQAHRGVVHFIDTNNEGLDTGSLGQHGMLARLTSAVEPRLELTFAHRDDEASHVSLRGTACADQTSVKRVLLQGQRSPTTCQLLRACRSCAARSSCGRGRRGSCSFCARSRRSRGRTRASCLWRAPRPWCPCTRQTLKKFSKVSLPYETHCMMRGLLRIHAFQDAMCLALDSRSYFSIVLSSTWCTHEIDIWDLSMLRYLSRGQLHNSFSNTLATH